MYETAFNNIGRQLRAEEGIANELDYVEQISWVMFLKYLHDLETERRDRAELDGKDGMQSFEGELKNLLLAILQSYETTGESELAAAKLAQFLIARYGSVGEGKTKLGDLSGVSAAYRRMQAELYTG